MTLLLLHAGAALFMTGLIWFVQIVHYPLLGRVESNFERYELEHMRRTTWVVGPAMLIETTCAALLVISIPAGVDPLLAWTGAALLALIWVSTALLQAPAHQKLAKGRDERRLRLLVQTNWIRTIAWSARSAIALVMLAQGARA
ncbi:MAG: hypothetical protein EA376_04390 [Phycisphaeraceae bacterium]|nr:MAG: hypothetical protein EA376_04390 [Phycisphaeraceae bacterium]